MTRNSSSWPTLASQSGGRHFSILVVGLVYRTVSGQRGDDQAVDTSQIPGITLGFWHWYEKHELSWNILIDCSREEHLSLCLQIKASCPCLLCGVGWDSCPVHMESFYFQHSAHTCCLCAQATGLNDCHVFAASLEIFQAAGFCGFLSTHSIVILASRICLNLSISGYTILFLLHFIALGFLHFEHIYFYLIKISGGTGVCLIYHPEWECRSRLNFHFLIRLSSSLCESTLHLFEHLCLILELFLKTGHAICNFFEAVENYMFILLVFFLA